MYQWLEFKINTKFTQIKLKPQNLQTSWPSEVNVLLKKYTGVPGTQEKSNSHIFKLFFRYFQQLTPINYIFENHKMRKRIEYFYSSKLFFQLPEGMGRYYEDLVQIFKKTTRTILSIYVSCQVTYGACCIQDCLANNFGSSLILHYGHSCLTSILNCVCQIIYIFVEIKYDFSLLIESIGGIFCAYRDKLIIGSTIQFSSELKPIKDYLSRMFKNLHIPQTKPLSPGELLGCTSFMTKNHSGAIYIGDGKFHIESILFFNPNIKIIQFNPFIRSLTLLGFKSLETLSERECFIEKAIFFLKSCNFIFGVLGRQGNMKILKTIKFLAIKKKLQQNTYTTAEISNKNLNILNRNSKEIWVQLSCPRLSLDWGFFFKNLLLTPFEFGVLTRSTKFKKNNVPMDFYSQKGKFWSNYLALKTKFNIAKPVKIFFIYKHHTYLKNFI